MRLARLPCTDLSVQVWGNCCILARTKWFEECSNKEIERRFRIPRVREKWGKLLLQALMTIDNVVYDLLMLRFRDAMESDGQ